MREMGRSLDETFGADNSMHFLRGCRGKRQMRKIVILIIISGVFSLVLQAQTAWETEIICVEKNQDTLKKLARMNLDLLMEKDGNIYIVADPDDLVNLELNQIPYLVKSHLFSSQIQEQVSTQSGVNGEFHSYAELERDLMELAEAYPDLARVSDIGDSLEQRNIYALKISDNVWTEEQEAGVIFLGCHHAREWISVEVPFLLGKYLLDTYDSNAEVRQLVNNSEIWIVPLVNPDGLEYSIHFYRYWRKNRRDNGAGIFGVDLNRNYGYKWGYDDEGSSPDPSSDVYRGPEPFSEPEIQAVRDLFVQKSFQALVSYHNFSQVILYPWGYTQAASDQDDLLAEIAQKMAALMEPVNGRYYYPDRAGASFYLTNGDTTDWSFGVYGIPSYTVELPPSSTLGGEFFNPESDILPIFNENLPAMLYLIDWSIKDYDRQTLHQMEQRKHRNTTRPSRLK
jgi:carboxypeptidase T